MPKAHRLASGLVLLSLPALIIGQPTARLDRAASDPLLPTGIVLSDVDMDGQLAHLWSEADGTRVVHVVGGFRLQAGARVLSAAQAVVWLTSRRGGGRSYQFIEVFLYHDARVAEPAGTVTEGPLLFVTISTTGEVFVSADRRSFGSSADTAIYRDAAAVRDRVRQGGLSGTSVSAPVTITPETIVGPEIPPEFHFSAELTRSGQTEDGRSVITCVGSVDLFRGATSGTPALELQADAAVVFLRESDDSDSQAGPNLSIEAGVGDGSRVEAVYLEGDIRMTLGDRTVRASRLYYDLLHDRALILDAVAHAMVPRRNLPIYLRAETIRQLSQRHYVAEDAVLTTSEFHTPHYHIGTERIELIDRTARTYFNGRGGLSRANYKMGPTTFNLYNVPIWYWPGAAGKVSLADTAIRRISTGYDGSFGTRVETKWDWFSLLSLEPPEGFAAELSLDYFTDRGPAIGLDVDYETDDSFGLFRGYGIDDRGDDKLGRFRANERSAGTRGRAMWRHRQYLPDDWQLTVEGSYLSDRAFLEEYSESEFDEGKEQETLIYLKKQRDHWAFTGLLQWRVNDFLTQTEHFPEFALHLVGQPLGGVASWYSQNRAGVARYRAAEKEFFLLLREGSDRPSSRSTARVDSRQEVTIPLRVGAWTVVPFAAIRGSAWDSSRDRHRLSPLVAFDRGGSGVGRVFATYGVRAATYLSRVFPNVRNELLDLDGLRHVIKPELVAWASHSNRDSDDLFPFDESVEGIEDFDGVLIGLHQRLQTKRGGGDLRRTVDWITFDVDFGFFNDGAGDEVTNGFISYTRPERSVPRNFINSATHWRINDSTMLLGELNYDLNDGEVDRLDFALQVDRTPRFSYGLDYRFIGETDSNLLGFGMKYRADEKHAFVLSELFDLERGRTHELSVTYVRRYPRWFVAVTLEFDDAEDNTGVSLSIWPEGLPRAAIGTRRFTGLAASTALSP